MDLNVVSPTETVYSRGESFLENSLYSDPTTWSGLSENQRREFIRRTDRAVFSQDAQNLLSARGIHRHIQGRVLSVQATADALNLEIAHPGTNVIHTAEADVVIDARGGNSLWFLELLTPALLEDVAASCGGELTAEALEQRIGHDLSLIGCPAKIFIPNLAALRQGPGFPNLSSLGILSDRVLAGLASRQPTSQAAAAVNAS